MAYSQDIPDGIRYIPAEDSINTAALDKLRNLLFLKSSDDISKAIACGPFFWQELLDNSIFSPETGIAMECYIPLKGELHKLEGRVIRWEKETKKLLTLLRNIISSSEDFTIRKLKPDEIKIYWMMIAYDIEEPVFVLDGPGLRLVIECTETGEIMFMDNYYRFLKHSED